MINTKSVKVMIINTSYSYRYGILISQENQDLYRIELLEGPPETYRGQPVFITELILRKEDFIIIEGLGEILYE